MTALVKVTGENAKRKTKVAQMAKAAVSDSEEDEGAVDQMEVTARQQASALQAEEGDPEPVVLQQVLFHIQVSQHRPVVLVNQPSQFSLATHATKQERHLHMPCKMVCLT